MVTKRTLQRVIMSLILAGGVALSAAGCLAVPIPVGGGGGGGYHGHDGGYHGHDDGYGHRR